MSLDCIEYMQTRSSLPRHTQSKSDIVFYDAFTQLRRSNSWQIFQMGLCLAVFLVLIGIDMQIYQADSDKLIVSFMVNTVTAVTGLIIAAAIHHSIFRNPRNYIVLALATKHTVHTQPLEDLSEIQPSVSSTIYIAENAVMAKDIDQEVKKTHIKLIKNIINDAIRNRFAWVKNYQIIYMLTSLVSMFYSIYILIQVQMGTLDRVILSIYASLLLITNLPLFIICGFYLFVFLGIAAIFIIGFCFSKRRRNDDQFIDLKSTNARATETQCPICQAQIKKQQKIYVLPCSEKHVFHSQCLRNWAKVKSTCPICRGEIPMANVNRYNTAQKQPLPDSPQSSC